MAGLERFRGFVARNTDLFLAVGIAAGAVYFFSGYFTPVRFDRERIEVLVKRGQIHVRGLYHYANTSRLPAVLTLRVPFPVDSDHPQPERFALCDSSEDGREGAEIVPAVRAGDVSFRLLFRPREVKWVRLDYVQPSRVNRGRYLLTTTKPWRRPIDRADFVLRLPEQLDLSSSNFPVQPSSSADNGKTFVFSRTDFYPDQDWIFAWAAASVESASATGRQP